MIDIEVIQAILLLLILMRLDSQQGWSNRKRISRAWRWCLRMYRRIGARVGAHGS